MKKDFYQTIYLFYFVSALLFMFGANTHFIYYGAISIATKLLSPVLSLVVVILCLKRYTSLQQVLVFLAGLLVMIVAINSSRNVDSFLFLYLSYVILIGAKDIPFRTIVKIHFCLAFSFCLFNMTVSELGLINKVSLLLPAERESFLGDIIHRKDFGYGWSTDYAIHVLFILLDYWILRNGILRIGEYIIYILVSVFIIVNCDARMATLNIYLILAFSLYVKYKSKKNRTMNKFTSFYFLFSVPIFAFISIWATISYDPTNIYWYGTDVLLSGRLSISQMAIEDVGFSWFGQVYEMFGNGNIAIGDEYNFIDCTYLQSFVIWGVILTVVWIYTYYEINRNALKRKDWVLISAVFISGVAGLIAPYSCNFRYCILLLAIVANHSFLNFPIISRNELC